MHLAVKETLVKVHKMIKSVFKIFPSTYIYIYTPPTHPVNPIIEILNHSSSRNEPALNSI